EKSAAPLPNQVDGQGTITEEKLQRRCNAQLSARLTQRKLPRHWVKRSPAYAQNRPLTN
ncbi:hypothetical protein HPB47_002596, partial [Ixodes persulcatus]